MTAKMKILTGITSIYSLVAPVPFVFLGFFWLGSIFQSLFTGADDSLVHLAAPLTVLILIMYLLFPVCYIFNIVYDAFYITGRKMETLPATLWIIALILLGSITATIFWCMYILPQKPEEKTKEADPWQ